MEKINNPEDDENVQQGWLASGFIVIEIQDNETSLADSKSISGLEMEFDISSCFVFRRLETSRGKKVRRFCKSQKFVTSGPSEKGLA